MAGILEDYNNKVKSEMYRLEYRGEIVGYRLKYFDENEGKFIYYDMDTDTMKDKFLQEELKMHGERFKTLPMKIVGDTLITVEEYNANAIITEAKDYADVAEYLEGYSKVYKLLNNMFPEITESNFVFVD